MFLFPPRPTNAIIPSLIPLYEGKGYIAQLKKNGTCSLAFIDDAGNVTLKTRHNEDHKAWQPTIKAIRFFSGYRSSIFVFELLHSKGGDVRDTIYIFDVLKFKGRDLIGTMLKDRLAILKTIVTPEKISIAHTYTTGLLGLFEGLTSPLDEGIVLKRPDAILRSCQKDGLNSNWQVKCRKPTKNYGF